MNTFKTSLAACGLVMALGACGDDATKPAGDATTTTDGTTTDTTTNTNTSTATDTTGDTSTPACDETGITVATQFLDYDPESDVTRYEGATSGDLVDAILIQFYPSLDGSVPSPLTGPGTYEIGANAADQNFESCQTCVLALKNCGEDGCDKVFFATAGTITVTALDQDEMVFVGTLTNATLVEVTIDDETSESTPVANGDTWCVPSFAFDSTPECITSFDCTVAEPICEQTGLTCVADVAECTSGEDASEPNDGPLAATAITVGEAKAGAACTGPSELELDWYTFTTTGEKNLSAKVTWENPDASFFVLFVSSNEEVVGEVVASDVGLDEQLFALAPAGTYYAVVVPSDTSEVGGGTTAVPYSLTITVTDPECSSTVACAAGAEPICNLERGECVACVSDFDCTSAATPACVVTEGVAACAAVAVCTGDDEPDADDGPTAATALTLDAAATSAKICGEDGEPSGDESDWYKLELAAVTDLTLTLTWEGDADLDFFVYDAEGVAVGESIFDQPEVLDLADLATGTYFIEVLSFAGADPAAIGYTIRATTTAP